MQPEKSTKVYFANQLRLLCKQHGLKQKDIAELCGVSPAGANKWFKGGDISVENAATLSRHFGISIEELVGICTAARSESDLRIDESAKGSDAYETDQERQLAFEKELTKKHLDSANARADVAEKKLKQLRRKLSKIVDELGE